MKIDQYTSVILEDGGKYGYSLMEGWTTDDGAFKTRFCRREFKKGDGEKLCPVSVKLGDKAKAIEVCLYLYKELTGQDLEEPF